MRVKGVLLATAALTGMCFGQAVITSSGYGTSSGSNAKPAPPSPALTITPSVNYQLTSPAPVGATNATSNLQVGASNATVNNSVAPEPAVITQAQISNPNITSVNTTAQEEQAGAAEQAGTSEASAAPLRVLNLGASASYDASTATGTPATPSLAEIAAQYRRRPQQQQQAAAHVYTNQDLQTLSAKSDISTVPNDPATLNNSLGIAGSMPASDQGAVATQAAPAASAGAGYGATGGGALQGARMSTGSPANGNSGGVPANSATGTVGGNGPTLPQTSGPGMNNPNAPATSPAGPRRSPFAPPATAQPGSSGTTPH
jgi:hypothetical protein